MAHDGDELGPIDYLVVEFPGSRMTGRGLPMLVELVEPAATSCGTNGVA